MQLKHQRTQNTQTRQEVVQQDNKVQALKLANDTLERKLEEVDKNLWDAGQRFKHMEELVKVEDFP